MTANRPMRGRRRRRGFNLIELLIALAITGALLSATMVAMDASFMAYQATTEMASTHTIARLVMHRMLSLIRTGQDFGPFPLEPQVSTLVESDDIEFLTRDGDLVVIQYDRDDELLTLNVDVGADNTPGTFDHSAVLLEGVVDQGNTWFPFTLRYDDLGIFLHRATIDLEIVPDDNMAVTLDGQTVESIRLVASAMPRMEAYMDEP